MTGQNGEGDAPVTHEDLLWPIITVGGNANRYRAIWPRAAAFLAPGRTIAACSRKFSVHRTTVKRWLAHPDFLELVRDCQIEYRKTIAKRAVAADFAETDGDPESEKTGRKRAEDSPPISIRGLQETAKKAAK